MGANHVAARDGIPDSAEATERYVRSIANGSPEALDVEAMRRWLSAGRDALAYWERLGAVRWTVIPGLPDYHGAADGAALEGRYLTSEPFAGSQLGPWRELLRTSPYFPVGLTYPEMLDRGRRSSLVSSGARAKPVDVPAFGSSAAGGLVQPADPDRLTFGPGLVAGFLSRVLAEPGIEIRLSERVTALRTDAAGRVVGVVAHGSAGSAEYDGPVVLATSTFDWDPELVQEFLGIDPEDFGSVAPRSLRGDGIRLARSVGGATARIPATTVPMKPGWSADSGEGFAYGPEYALPHGIIVDRTGRRFCDESYWVDIIRTTLDVENPHLPFFLVWDEQHHRKYGLGSTPPGGAYTSDVVTGRTLEEVGRQLGVDEAQLAETVAEFNRYAVVGQDPAFGRGTVGYARQFAGDPSQEPNPVLGEVSEPPFFGLRLRLVSTAIGCSGIHIDSEGRVRSERGGVVDGLYAVGSCTATTTSGSGYNSGFALSRGLTLAYLVADQLG
jgi:3-oxosteroid 1-dehydrogenase